MTKYKVIKKWPGGPEVGTIGEMRLENVSFPISSNYGRWHTPKELEGFVEELKVQKMFWFLNNDGSIHVGYVNGYADNTADWFRFRTKESAEKFRDALKESHGNYLEYWSNPDTDKFFVKTTEALNDRVTD